MACSLLDNNATFLASVAASAAVVKPLGVDLLAEFRRKKGWQVRYFWPSLVAFVSGHNRAQGALLATTRCVRVRALYEALFLATTCCILVRAFSCTRSSYQ